MTKEERAEIEKHLSAGLDFMEVGDSTVAFSVDGNPSEPTGVLLIVSGAKSKAVQALVEAIDTVLEEEDWGGYSSWGLEL